MTNRIKKERIASVVAGSILFILAAIFTIAIFVRIFDYGANPDSDRSSLFKLGHMLYSAYGFCSLLIPLFFIISGSFCFDSHWSVQRSLCLIVSPIPFMTFVIAEKLIRASLTSESHAIAFVKITLLSVVSLLLIAVEYLLTVIMAGKLRKKLNASQKTSVTSAPVFERDDSGKSDDSEHENKIEKFVDSLVKKFKKLTQKDSKITSVPDSSFSDTQSTVEIVLSEGKGSNGAVSDETVDDDDDSTFQEPTIAENFFDEKKNLLVDSGDSEINQSQEDEGPKSFGQIIASPFKSLFKKAQDKYKDIMDYGEMQDKENSAQGTSGKNQDNAGNETEAVDINDFFKKPAERVVLKEDDYSDLDLPPHEKVQDTLTNIENSPSHSILEYNDYAREDDYDVNEESGADEAQDYEESIVEDDEAVPAETEFVEFPEDEEDIIGMFERQNQKLEDNNFLDQFEAESEPEQEEDAAPDVDEYVDAQAFEEDNSFISEIRQRISSRENSRTPAQIKAQKEAELAARLQEEKEEAERQKKIQEEKLFARIREQLKERTKKPVEFNFVPDLKSEVSANDTDLSDVFEKMNRDVLNTVEQNPEYKARFAQEQAEPHAEPSMSRPDPAPDVISGENLSEIQQRHKSFIARAEALKAAKEAKAEMENQAVNQEEPDARSVDYVFGEQESDQDMENLSETSSFINDSIVVADVSDDDEVVESYKSSNEEIQQESFIDDGDEEDDFPQEEIDAEDYEEENQQEEEPVDYVFQAEKKEPPKPQGWNSVYNIPYNLLTAYEDNPYWIIDDETKAAAKNLKDTLAEFKIDAEVTGIQKGPVVTMFEILPAPGVKLNRIVALADNIALRLAANSVRIVAPIPGRHAVGIEVPNASRAIISIRECLEADRPEWTKMGVPVVLGKDIQGKTQIIDLVKTPHLLIAGATGAGKSVCVNSMIVSMLYKRSPREVKLILIDPKIVELKLYNDIPHLLTPVITEPKKAMQALQYCLCEMERRYALLDGMSVRDISSYNKKIAEKHIATEKLPYLIVIIDEFADLMATTGKQLEGVVARLAAMSRAVGIHLVLATQRPSIDVITGLIKANIPSRIAFMVASKIDSRIILDQPGAEKLLGKGDMLYTSATDPFPNRIQGTFVSDQEVENIVDAVKSWGEPEYIDDEIFFDDDEDESSDDEPLYNPDVEDPLYEKALEIVVQAGKASASYIQRRLKIGYNRAARLVEEMEERGIVGPANGSKPREIIHMP